MKDNRDPQVIGDFLLTMRTQEQHKHLTLSQVADMFLPLSGEGYDDYSRRIAKHDPELRTSQLFEPISDRSGTSQ